MNELEERGHRNSDLNRDINRQLIQTAGFHMFSFS